MFNNTRDEIILKIFIKKWKRVSKIIPARVPLDIIYDGKICETGRLDLKIVNLSNLGDLLCFQIEHSDFGEGEGGYRTLVPPDISP